MWTSTVYIRFKVYDEKHKIEIISNSIIANFHQSDYSKVVQYLPHKLDKQY